MIICSPRLGWAPVRGNAAGYFSTSEAAHFVIVLGQLFHIGDEFLLALDGAVEGRKIFPNAIFWIFRRPEREDGEGRIPAGQHGECHMPDFYRWMPVFGAANFKCHFESICLLEGAKVAFLSPCADAIGQKKNSKIRLLSPAPTSLKRSRS